VLLKFWMWSWLLKWKALSREEDEILLCRTWQGLEGLRSSCRQVSQAAARLFTVWRLGNHARDHITNHSIVHLEILLTRTVIKLGEQKPSTNFPRHTSCYVPIPYNFKIGIIQSALTRPGNNNNTIHNCNRIRNHFAWITNKMHFLMSLLGLVALTSATPVSLQQPRILELI